MKDGLSEILEKLHNADVIVLGSPIYFGTETAAMRGLMERLCFQYLLYSLKKPTLAPEKTCALIYTMNVADMSLYNDRIMSSKSMMERVFRHCDLLVSTNTKQFNDYSKYEADYFDVDAKLKKHEEIFPKELEDAFDFGKKLVR